MGIEARLNRLLGASGNCLDVAIDHGAFNEGGFLSGIEDMEKAVATVFTAGPDAIQLTVGQAGILQSRLGRDRPALVLRTDIANVYGNKLPKTLFSKVMDEAVEQALAWDAACVVVNLLLLPGQPELHHACIENISRLKPACVRYGMPLMVEPLVMKDNASAGGYMVDGDLAKILPLVRQAVELGADLIKADPCDDVREYHRVVTIARKPVLVRGGGRAADKEVLERSVELMKQGARGLVYGRNIIQHPKPAGMTKALMAVVHAKAGAGAALDILNTAAQ